MPNYEITISVHIPDELVTLAKMHEQFAGRLVRPEPDTRTQIDFAKKELTETKAAPPTLAEDTNTTPPVLSGPVTVEQAKAAVIKWAETNGGPAKAKDALQKHFGVKLSEIDESQAEAIVIHFTGGAN